jgi:hypothetical protein
MLEKACFAKLPVISVVVAGKPCQQRNTNTLGKSYNINCHSKDGTHADAGAGPSGPVPLRVSI